MFLVNFLLSLLICSSTVLTTSFVVGNASDFTTILSCATPATCNIRSAIDNCLTATSWPVTSSGFTEVCTVQINDLGSTFFMTFGSIEYDDTPFNGLAVSIKIVGPATGSLIEGSYTTQFLSIDNEGGNGIITIHFENVTLRKFKAPYGFRGGALFFNQVTNPRFDNVIFESNNGVAMYIEFSGSVYLSGCSFVSNVNDDGNGGGLAIGSNINNIEILSCSFIDNIAQQNAGSAIYFEGSNQNISIIDSDFFGDSKNTGELQEIKFSTDDKNILIQGCRFNDSSIQFNERNYEIVISSSTFSANPNINSAFIVFLEEVEDVTISDLIFDVGSVALNFENNAERVLISNCSFSDLAGQPFGGISFHENSQYITIKGCSFLSMTGAIEFKQCQDCIVDSSNFGFNSGFADVILLLVSQNVSFTNDVFSNFEGSIGGSVLLMVGNSMVTFDNCSFINNTAHTTNESLQVNFGTITPSGAAISAIYSNADMKINNCVFIGNVAESSGGAIVSVYSNSGMTIQNSLFLNNSGGVVGGAISLGLFNRNCTIGSNVFDSNIASVGGSLNIGSFNDDMKISDNIFKNNKADSCGAISAGQVQLLPYIITDTTFQGNQADSIGGALCLDGDASMSNIVFEDNWSGNSGGSMSVSNANVDCSGCQFSSSSSSIGGSMLLFSANMALSSSSSISSSASTLGGFASLFLSKLTISDGSTIQGSSAGSLGGAFSVESLSTLSVVDSAIEMNSAGDGGGAVFVTSQSSFEGRRSIISQNSGKQGGAIVANIDSPVTIDSCIFQGNDATDGAGGAILMSSNELVVTDSSFSGHSTTGDGGVMRLIGLTLIDVSSSNFNSNTAMGTGGVLDIVDSTLVISSSSFSSSIADEDGGAIHLTGDSSGDISFSSFSANSAVGFKGGSIFISITTSNDISISSSNFSSNNARWGSAIFIDSGDLTIDENSFTNNAAASSGSVFWIPDSSSLTSLAANTFSANTAGYGPDLSTTSQSIFPSSVTLNSSSGDAISSLVIQSNDFYGNLVTKFFEAGTIAVSSSVALDSPCDGSLSGQTVSVWDDSMDTADFTNLIITCEPGTVVTVDFSTTIDDKTLTTSTNVYLRDCMVGEEDISGVCVTCPDGKYSLEVGVECKVCPDHAACKGGGEIIVDEGYWRSDDASIDILACWVSEPCLGGSSSSSQCMEGHTDAYCSVCDEGYTKDPNTNICVDCASGIPESSQIVIVVFIVIIGLVLAVSACKHVMELRNSVEKSDSEGVGSLFQSASTKFKILLVHFQISTTIPQILNLKYPATYTDFNSSFQLLNFDPSNIFALDCDAEYNFHDRLVIMTIWPILFIFVSFLVILLCRTLFKLTSAMNNAITVMLMVSFLVFASASTVVFQTFVCEEFDDGSNLLVADYSIHCDSPKHQAYVSYAIFMLLVYPIGIPIGYLCLLLHKREDIMSQNTENLGPVKFLSQKYKPSCWYFDVVECVRRLLMMSVPALIYRNSEKQICILIYCIYSEFNAFESYWNNICWKASQLVILLRVLVGCTLKTRALVKNDSEETWGLVAYSLVLMDVFVIMIPVYAVLMGLNVQEKDTAKTQPVNTKVAMASEMTSY